MLLIIIIFFVVVSNSKIDMVFADNLQAFEFSVIALVVDLAPITQVDADPLVCKGALIGWNLDDLLVVECPGIFFIIIIWSFLTSVVSCRYFESGVQFWYNLCSISIN